MRVDTTAFALKNLALTKEPRHVIEQAFDDAATVLRYFTSHTDAATPGSAIVIPRMIEGVSGTGQTLNPDTANASIGAIKYQVVDKAGAITASLGEQLGLGRSMRRKRTRVYEGFKGLAWEDYTLVQTQLVDKDISFDAGAYDVACADIQRELRKDIFEVAKTNLTQSLLRGETTINVVATAAFETVEHGLSYSDAPSATVGYVRIDDEFVRYTGKTSTTFTGCTRGALNTREVDHVVDASAAVERRTAVAEYVYLEMPGLKLIYALKNGRILGTDNLLLRSEEFDNASWSKTNVTVTADDAVAPDGRTTADKIAATASAATSLSQAATVAATFATFSVYVKKGSGATDANKFKIRNATTATDLLEISIDYDTRAITYVTGSAGAALYEDLNGALRLVLVVSSGISSGNSIAAYVAFTGAAETAGEYCHAWGAMMNATALELLPYAKTTTAARTQAVLPAKWHTGIDRSYLRLADFLDKRDLWEPLDDELGFVVRGEDLQKTDGKKLIEEQLELLCGVFAPVYADGALGCKRMANVLSGAAYGEMLDDDPRGRNNVVSHSGLTHDFGALHNVINIDWSWEPLDQDYKRRNFVIEDSDSIAIYGKAALYKKQFRFLHGSRHTETMLKARFDSIRDRYTGPPLRLSVTVIPGLNTLEVGDIVRVRLSNVQDYTMPGGGGPIDRSFEIQGIQIDWITGLVTLKLMGSSRRPGEISASSDATVLSSAWYTGTGTQLSTVLTIAADHVTASGSLAGAADLTSAPAIYYHDGDLTNDAGVTIDISENVWIRVRGFFTNNGTITGKGAGHIGAAAVSSVTSPSSFNPGTAGFLGAVQAGGGFQESKPGYDATNSVALVGVNATVPHFPLLWDGTTLHGVPADLRGTSGSSGMPIYDRFAPRAGGAGGGGGAGLAITSRGFAQGAAGKIDLSGDDGLAGTPIVDSATARTIYPGSGAGGAPGGFFLMLDGAGAIGTDIDDGGFVAKNGKTPIQGTPIDRILIQSVTPTPGGVYQSIHVGTGDDTIFPLPDMSGARGASRVQYVPADPAAEGDPSPDDALAQFEELMLANLTLRPNAKNFALRAVASDGAGTLVAVGDADGTDSLIYRSTNNGLTWAEEANPKNIRLNAVAYSPTLDMFLAAGNGDGTDTYIVTSTAGGAWAEQAPMVAKNVAIRAACWAGPGLFVLVGDADGTDAYILTSTNGTTLVERSNPQNIALNAVAWSAAFNRVVAVGDSTGAGPYKPYVIWSDGAITWNNATVETKSESLALLAVSAVREGFVAVGQGEASADTYIERSLDGKTYAEVAAPSVDDMNCLATSGVLVYARGSFASISSRDSGRTWRDYGSEDETGGADTWGLCWSGHRYVGVGAALGSEALILTSLAR